MGNDRRQLRGHGHQEGFLAFVKTAPFGLLNDQHAQHIALVNDGHTQEGVERLFAETFQQLEAGVALCVLEVDRFFPLGDEADQALTRRQAGLAHLQWVQAFRGAKDETPAGLIAHVDAADLGPHGIADPLDDDLQRIIEPLGGVHLLHNVAERLKHHGCHQLCASVRRASGGASSFSARR